MHTFCMYMYTLCNFFIDYNPRDRRNLVCKPSFTKCVKRENFYILICNREVSLQINLGLL